MNRLMVGRPPSWSPYRRSAVIGARAATASPSPRLEWVIGPAHCSLPETHLAVGDVQVECLRTVFFRVGVRGVRARFLGARAPALTYRHPVSNGPQRDHEIRVLALMLDGR